MPGKLTSTLFALLAGAATAVAVPAPSEASPPGEKDVTAVMFEWDFDSVARECTDTLGPAGYGYVQVSPPQERIQGNEWWTGYQPVSYRIAGPLGSRDDFAAMVQTCHSAGVKVVADAVINHMATGSGTGTGGSGYGEYDYPGLYSGPDMDDCRRTISDYTDRWEVQHCELLGLPDLDTGEEHVRDTIAGYLDDLLSLGVDGFRIDAAKHIPATDLAAIKSRLSDPDTYFKMETIGSANEPVKPSEYAGVGDPQEFTYARDLKRVFNTEKLAYLKNFGEDWGYLPSDTASVFVTNHDTERNGQTLTYADGATYTLAQVFSLAWPYGSPDVHSGYAFSDTDAGAPNGGRVDACGTDGWECQHAWPEVASMVGWRNTAGDAPVTNWWDDGGNRIAFGRGSQAYVAINHDDTALTRTFQTSLAAGDYCDVQTGTAVTVDDTGSFTATVAPQSALALHTGARTCDDGSQDATTGASFGVQATTTWGENIYVTGNRPELGNWSPADAVKLSAANYPTWTGQVDLPGGTSFEYKYVRIDADGNVTWESGANRTATVPESGTVQLDDTWRN